MGCKSQRGPESVRTFKVDIDDVVSLSTFVELLNRPRMVIELNTPFKSTLLRRTEAIHAQSQDGRANLEKK